MRLGSLFTLSCAALLVASAPVARAAQLSCAYIKKQIAYCDEQLKRIRNFPLQTPQEKRVALEKMQGFRDHYAAQLATCGGKGGAAAGAQNDGVSGSLKELGKSFEALSGAAGRAGDAHLGQLQELANRPVEMNYEGAGRRRANPGGARPEQVDLDDLADEASADGSAAAATTYARYRGPSPGRCALSDAACLRRQEEEIARKRREALRRLKAITPPKPEDPKERARKFAACLAQPITPLRTAQTNPFLVYVGEFETLLRKAEESCASSGTWEDWESCMDSLADGPLWRGEEAGSAAHRDLFRRFNAVASYMKGRVCLDNEIRGIRRDCTLRSGSLDSVRQLCVARLREAIDTMRCDFEMLPRVWAAEAARNDAGAGARRDAECRRLFDR